MVYVIHVSDGILPSMATGDAVIDVMIILASISAALSPSVGRASDEGSNHLCARRRKCEAGCYSIGYSAQHQKENEPEDRKSETSHSWSEVLISLTNAVMNLLFRQPG